MDKMNIAVLFGGLSSERLVSVRGGRAVVSALRELGHDVVPVDPLFGSDLKLSEEEIQDDSKVVSVEESLKISPRVYLDCINSGIFDNIDVAFIVLHGKYGEDGKIQSLLELRGIPYIGSNVKSSALSIDKNASKMIFLSAGIPTPPWMIVRHKDVDNYELFEDIRQELGNKIVVKPNDQGSTIGITIIDSGNLDEIHEGIIEAFKYSDIVLVEKFIEGREITVAIIGEEPFPIIEIEPEDGYYDYEHKYTKGKTQYYCPADLTEDITEFTQSLAHTAYLALGCSGFARADFRLDEDGQSYLLEMNTIPGFTATSLVPMAAKEVGIEFPELCERLIDLALGKEVVEEEK
jgi:D-alanine-D-alanine ligase